MCSVEARVPLLNDERVCSGQAEATCIAMGTAQRNATDVDETGRHSRLEFVFRRRPTCDDIDLDALHTIAEPEDRTTYSVRDSVLR